MTDISITGTVYMLSHIFTAFIHVYFFKSSRSLVLTCLHYPSIYAGLLWSIGYCEDVTSLIISPDYHLMLLSQRSQFLLRAKL